MINIIIYIYLLESLECNQLLLPDLVVSLHLTLFCKRLKSIFFIVAVIIIGDLCRTSSRETEVLEASMPGFQTCEIGEADAGGTLM